MRVYVCVCVCVLCVMCPLFAGEEVITMTYVDGEQVSQVLAGECKRHDCLFLFYNFFKLMHLVSGHVNV